MRSVFIGLFLFASLAANASTLTVDFEGPVETEGDNGVGFPLQVTTQGYVFSSASGLVLQAPGAFPTKTLNYCPGCTMTMENELGQLFSLDSLNYASAGSSGNVSIDVIGYYAGGASISKNLLLDGSLQNYDFGAGWDNLESVVFGSTSVSSFGNALDNIAVSTVPVPAAAWLFGSALAGLGWLRRKQAV